MYLTLRLYFEAVITTMLAILGFPVSADLYNSFDILLICFHDLINKLFSKLDFVKNWNSIKFLSYYIPSMLRLSSSFWHSFGRAFIARIKFLYGQSVRFPASFPCLSFPAPFLYIARTEAVLTGPKAY